MKYMSKLLLENVCFVSCVKQVTKRKRMTGYINLSAQGKSRIFDARTGNPFEHTLFEGSPI
jgi:hypothetical protein